MKPSRKIASLSALSILALTLCVSCTRSKNPDRVTAANSGKVFVVTTASAPFYRYGPQQPNGPDQKLPKDTLVTLIRKSWGYAKVSLSTGEQGFVSSDDIRAAPSALIAALNPPPVETPPDLSVDPNDPRLRPTPAPLPEFEPTPLPSPSASGN